MPLGYLTQQFTICGEVLAGDDVRGKAAAVLWAFADLVLPLSEPADVHDVLGGTVVTGARQVEARRHRVYRIDKEGASGFRVGPPISCGPGRENRVSRSVPARGRSASGGKGVRVRGAVPARGRSASGGKGVRVSGSVPARGRSASGGKGGAEAGRLRVGRATPQPVGATHTEPGRTRRRFCLRRHGGTKRWQRPPTFRATSSIGGRIR
jgi:hypothetical protein